MLFCRELLVNCFDDRLELVLVLFVVVDTYECGRRIFPRGGLTIYCRIVDQVHDFTELLLPFTWLFRELIIRITYDFWLYVLVLPPISALLTGLLVRLTIQNSNIFEIKASIESRIFVVVWRVFIFILHVLGQVLTFIMEID